MAEQRINLNTATAEELMQLPGIGSVLAQRIVTYRDTVHPYDEPAGIMAVSGIGEMGYREIADRLTVAAPSNTEGSGPRTGGGTAVPAPAEVSPSTADVSPDEEEEDDVALEALTTEEASQAEDELISEEEAASEGEGELEIEAISPPRSTAPAEPPSEEGVAVEEAVAEELEEEVAPEGEQEPAEEDVVPEAAAESEEEPVEEEPAEWDLPPAPFAAPAEATPSSMEGGEATPSPPWWRRLSWLWTAILGGLLGMVFALIVWSGINGSLDVAHSRAVLGVESELNGLAADLETLGTDVEGLQGRLDALEGLATRMDEVESAVGDLHEETSELSKQADALEEDLDVLSEALQTVSEDVATLKDQAEQTQNFFSRLQALLNDIFGEVEETSMPTPTPTPEGK